MSVESNLAIALVLHCCALLLAKNPAPLSRPMRNKTKTNRDLLSRTRFPALGAGDIYLLRFLIGSLEGLPLL